MTSKLVYSPMDEKQKQLGCMNGIFQLFDRRQRGGVHNHMRLPPPPGRSCKTEMELKDGPEKSMEKDPKRFAKEKQRASVESSRTSFSSACSSTEPPSSSISIFPEAPPPIITVEQPTHIKPINLRDLVKDSMYREARCLSVKPPSNGEGVNRTMKHIDSPRPLQQQKSVQPRTYSQDKSNRNLWEAYKEEKDAPRFSYDGRVSQNKLKSSVKLKEMPRLSLDSRVESRKNIVRDAQRRSEATSQIINVDQETESNKRPSGLVVRLMGLEALPNPSTDNRGVIVTIKPYQDNDLVARMGEEVKQSQISGSPRVSRKEAASTRMGISSTDTKQPANCRLPLEPAPWRQGGGRRESQKPVFKTKEYPSVYGEIEKRLTELEFKKSGKDLRALKQILEAMQKSRRSLENTMQPLDLESKSSKCSPDYGSWDQQNHPVSPSFKRNNPPKIGQFPIMVMKPAKPIGKPVISDDKETSGLQKLRTRRFADEKNSHHGNPSGGPLPSPEKMTNARTLGPSLSPKVPEHIRERLTGSRETSVSGSPKLQQRRQGMEMLSNQVNQSDFSRRRKQSIKKPIRSNSNTKTVKPKSTNTQHKDDLSCGFNREARNLSQQSDTISMQSESDSSLASQNDTEITNRDWTCNISMYQSNDYNTRKCAARLIEDSSMAELATDTMEQPSPVSVLDASFYEEESPSPVKKMANAFKEYGTLTCDDAKWNQEGMHHFPSSTSTNGWSQFNHDKLENVRQLVDRITLLNSSPKKVTTNVTAPVYENRHPNHLYITEIFLASGFLENLGSSTAAIQLQSSGHLIDPNLFHILEKSREYAELANYEDQEKSVWSKPSERNRRKLLFDSVDEILVRKLAFTDSSEQKAISNKVRNLSGEKLLEQVWSEINNLQANSDNNMDDEYDELISIIRAEMSTKSTDWEEHINELPGLVLDIERLIFKDLISEVVSDGVADLLDQTVRHSSS